jgi:Crp-like helix-turn-helix domain
MHDDMGQMLGVFRSSVSPAAGALQKSGLIHYLRGRIRILNREGLEDAVCECYQAINRGIGYFSLPEVGMLLTESVIHRVNFNRQTPIFV